MDTHKFAEAQALYAAGDYRRAARVFLESIEKGTPIGNGPAYHMAGNSFMRLKRYTDASVVFEHALRDDTYQRRGAVEANLANSYLSSGDYSAAVAHYEAALKGDEQGAEWKYYQGMARAYMSQENYSQAALAYKHAALDEANPKPGKALLNLGLAMMAAGEPAAAVEAYRQAMASPGYDNKGRALLNTGIALHAQGKWRDAIRAIEEAQMLYGYKSSDLAQRTIADAREHLAIEQQVAAVDEEIAQEEWVEPELADALVLEQTETQKSVFDPEPEPEPEPELGLKSEQQTSELENLVIEPALDLEPALDPGPTSDPEPKPEPIHIEEPKPAEVEQFFSRTEREFAAEGREQARKQRKPLAWLKTLVIVVLVLAVLGGGVAALYFTGQGIPTAQTTVNDLLDAYNAGHAIQNMWAFSAQDDITRQMVLIPTSPDYTINTVVSGAQKTSVEVTVATNTGAQLEFTFTLIREGIGWKVSEVAPDLSGKADVPVVSDTSTTTIN